MVDEGGRAGGRGLAGRVALVTGGSRGIGAAVSRRLAEQGVHVVVTYRQDRSAANAMVEALDATAGSGEPVALDVADAEQVHQRVTEMLADHGRLDIVVANANAPFRRDDLERLSADELVEPVANNLRAAHVMTTLAVAGMRARGWGRLVYVGSNQAQGPAGPGMAANGIGKAALAAYLRFVVDELTGDGVTANLVSPGMVDTDASRSIGLPEHVRRLVVALTPTGRIAVPDDVAEAVGLLIDGGDLLNGVDLPVTGGFGRPIPLTRIAPLLQTVEPGGAA